jgi:hypothetical protein
VETFIGSSEQPVEEKFKVQNSKFKVIGFCYPILTPDY